MQRQPSIKEEKEPENTVENILSIFSPEILLHVFSFLNLKSIFALMLVSKKVKMMADDNYLWSSLFSQETQQPLLFKAPDYKGRLKYYKELINFRNTAHKLIQSYQGANEQRLAFLQLFSRLANGPAIFAEAMNCNLPKALIGALIFELEAIEDEKNNNNLGGYVRFGLMGNMTGSGVKFHTLIQIELMGLVKKLSFQDKAHYVGEFHLCIEKAPASLLEGLTFWPNKRKLLEEIQVVQQFYKILAKGEVRPEEVIVISSNYHLSG